MARFVSQTRFGGSQHPTAEQGNCVQAAIASLLNIPLEEAFDAVAAYAVEESGGPHWFHALEQWAREREMRVWWEEHALSGVMGLADVNSIDLPGDRHVVVARGLDIVHDPSPRYRERNVDHTFPEADPCFIYFMPLDPASLFAPAPEGQTGSTKRRLIYLASPYSHADPSVMEERFEAVCREAAVLMGRGLHVYSPIAHTHPIAVRGDLPKDWAFWEAYDRVMLAASTEVYVLQLDGWDSSKGVTAEIEIAREMGLPVTMRAALARSTPAPTNEVQG